MNKEKGNKKKYMIRVGLRTKDGEIKERLHGSKVEFEEAKRLADISSVLRDLDDAEILLNNLKKLLSQRKGDRLLIQSMWSSALIFYVRCFAKGKRYGLTSDIYQESKEALKLHDFFKNLRDKHVAHSVNPFEQVTTTLLLSDPRSSKKEVKGLYVWHNWLGCVSIKQLNDFLKLIHIAKTKVALKHKEYQSKVLEKAEQIPIDELYSKVTAIFEPPELNDAGKPRS